MNKAFWRGFVSHRLRVVLTGVAIALGVSLMAGTYMLTDTLNASYAGVMGSVYAGAAAVVSPYHPLGDNFSAQVSPITDAMLQRVREVPGVGEAAGEIMSDVTFLNAKGEAIGSTQGAPDIVVGVEGAPFNVLHTFSGRLPARAGEAAIDKDTAAHAGLRLGDTVEVSGTGPVQRFRLVGTVGVVGSATLAGASVAVLTMPQAQAVVGEIGRYDQIEVSAAGGLSPSALAERLSRALPHDVVVRTATAEVSRLASDFASNMGFLRDFLLIFASVALFVGGFIILNTFSVTVAQRTRETGLMRAMGASRRQVLFSTIAESTLLGLAGSLAGVGFGLVLVPGLEAVFRAAGSSIPNTATVVQARTIIVSMVVGLLVSVVAGLAPALRASRIPAVAAMREGVGAEPGRLAGRMVPISAAVFLAGVAMIVAGLVLGAGAALAGIGALVVFVGVALFSPRIIPGLARAVGTVVAWRGVTGVIARENARRQPGRTAVTSAALMVGLALVTFVSVFASGTKATIDSAVHSSFAGNLIVQPSGSNSNGIPASLAAALERVPGVGVVAPVAFGEAALKGANGPQEVTGVVPAALSKLYRVQWQSGGVGAFDSLGDTGAVVTKSFASSQHLHVGSALTLTTASGDALEVVVRAVASDKAHLLGSVTISRSLLERTFAQVDDGVDFIGFAHGASAAVVQHDVKVLLARQYPLATSQTAAQFVADEANQVDVLLDLVYVLLALAVVVSLFGLVNTLALAVHERRRELGLLRAVGSSRRQVRQMVRYESVITSLIGAVLGLVVGTGFAVTLARPLAGSGFVLSFPFTTLAALVVMAAVAGTAAAVLPARRAARLDVLSAIALD
jgi:putative ABC transport system permease protein